MNRKAPRGAEDSAWSCFPTIVIPPHFAILLAGMNWEQGQIQTYCVHYLFNHLSVAAEDSQWRASVVRSNVIFLSTAHLHGKQVSLITTWKFSTFVNTFHHEILQSFGVL